MKLKKIILLLFTLTFLFVGSVSIKADEDIDSSKNAYIYSKTNGDNVPVYFVLNSEVPVYDHEGESVFDFRRHFHIIDQRRDILKINNKVDGVSVPIDLGGYVWDFGGFTTSELGTYVITISYKGANGVEVSNKVSLTVIEEDVISPQIYGLFDTINVDIGSSFIDNIGHISAVDNVDGVINLGINNFSGYESIKDGALNSEHIVTLTVTDNAGNKIEITFTAIVKDLTAPIIHNAVNVETKVGKSINYKEGISFTDNYSTPDKIVVVYQFVTDETGDVVIEMDEIDFNKVGETYVKVIARDEGGAEAYKIFRVIIKDAPSLSVMLLYINLILIGVTIISLGSIYVVRKVIKNKK